MTDQIGPIDEELMSEYISAIIEGVIAGIEKARESGVPCGFPKKVIVDVALKEFVTNYNSGNEDRVYFQVPIYQHTRTGYTSFVIKGGSTN